MILYILLSSIFFLILAMAADWDEHFMLKLVFYCLFFYGIVLTVEQAGIEVVIKNPPAMQCIKYQTGLFGKQCTQYENKN